ncbi:MAG: hypothetical protein EOO91_14305 [Pedobacter sp.]|nr:MAG: hypothetical protein EOO91_14305 [Pedobacter sp.]
MDFIRIDIFIAFGIYSLLFLISSFIFTDKDRLYRLDELSARFISFIGLVYFSCFLTAITFPLFRGGEERINLLSRMFGPYWFAFFLPSLTYLLITQLIRFKWIRKSRTTRLFFVPFMLITFEQFVILITSLDRDYMPSSWSMATDINLSTFEMVFSLLIKILFYSIYIGLFYLITEKLKKFSFAKPNKETN